MTEIPEVRYYAVHVPAHNLPLYVNSIAELSHVVTIRGIVARAEYRADAKQWYIWFRRGSVFTESNGVWQSIDAWGEGSGSGGYFVPADALFDILKTIDGGHWPGEVEEPLPRPPFEAQNIEEYDPELLDHITEELRKRDKLSSEVALFYAKIFIDIITDLSEDAK